MLVCLAVVVMPKNSELKRIFLGQITLKLTINIDFFEFYDDLILQKKKELRA